MIITTQNEKFLLTKVNGIGTLEKTFLIFQIHVSILVGLATVALINAVGSTTLEILGAATSIIFINEFNEKIGAHLIAYLKIHKKKVVKDELFLEFELDERMLKASLVQQVYTSIGFAILSVFVISTSMYKCANFETWFE